MQFQLIVTSAATSAWGPGTARKIAPAKLPQFHIKNKVNLIGYLGNDAEVHTSNDRIFTTFQVATKSSYKDRQSGEYVSRTEWHRCVVFGGLSKFAGAPTKGAHVHVEGEIRSREYVPKKAGSRSKRAETKQRVWKIRVSSILKLDRAEKAAEEEQEQEAPTTEEAAF